MEMFDNFGIKTEICDGYGLKRNVYALIIKGNDNLLLFNNLIGFSSNRKKCKLKELIDKIMIYG
ncbi:hypothetical protein HZB88_04720 [archaeon]|nr:hypothetical protein [archaeon]